MNALIQTEWQRRETAHHAKVAAWIGPRRQRQSLHQSHPVEDFLWNYYSLSPGQLERWTPGGGTILENHTLPSPWKEFQACSEGICLTWQSFPAKRLTFVSWLRQLLENTAARQPQLGCAGLHEWAMLYRIPPRHDTTPMRLDTAAIAQVVESQPITCSHFDAFRHFARDAIPLNRLQPTRPTQTGFEQPGCLHANMDLYKWSYKLLPWTSSELVADCFELALKIRHLDMAATPYDLSEYGIDPVRVETETGRLDYAAQQARFSKAAQRPRAQLIHICNQILTASG